jgi:flagellar biosynthesis GTPase FlhF
MKRALVAFAAAVLLAGCGPSEQEIQARIDAAVAKAKLELQAQRQAEKAEEARLEEERRAEEARLAEEAQRERAAQEKAEKERLAQEKAEKGRVAEQVRAKEIRILKVADAWCKKERGCSSSLSHTSLQINLHDIETIAEIQLIGLLERLELPANVKMKISSTAPIHGAQTANYRNANITWSVSRQRGVYESMNTMGVDIVVNVN